MRTIPNPGKKHPFKIAVKKRCVLLFFQNEHMLEQRVCPLGFVQGAERPTLVFLLCFLSAAVCLLHLNPLAVCEIPISLCVPTPPPGLNTQSLLWGNFIPLPKLFSKYMKVKQGMG